MGLHVTIDHENRKVDMWGCLTSGCIRYEEYGDFVDAKIEDKRLDGLKAEKSIVIKKRGNYHEFVQDFMNNNYPRVDNVPKVDERELLEAYQYAVERIKRGARYVGLKIEHISVRGVRLYFRLRYDEKSDGTKMLVELDAEKDGERMYYFITGKTNRPLAFETEAAKAIGAYIKFSEYVSQEPPK